MRRRIGIVVMLVAVLGAAACDESLSKLAGPTPNLEPTFTAIQREVFQSTDTAGRVACTNCHTSMGRVPSGGISLDNAVAYDQLVNVASRQKPGAIRVIPGDPDNSYLVQKMEAAPGIVGRRMPFAGPPFLTKGQLLIVRRWITLGAPRN